MNANPIFTDGDLAALHNASDSVSNGKIRAINRDHSSVLTAIRREKARRGEV